MQIFTTSKFPTLKSVGSMKGDQGWSMQTILFAIALISFPVTSHAGPDRLVLGGDATEAPSLPGEERGKEVDVINVDTDSIGFRDGSFDDVVGVRLDGYQNLTPAVVLDKGWLVSRKLGVGGVYTLRSGLSELVLNGIYAPRNDVRIQLSASQTRMDGALSSFGGVDKTMVQTSTVSSIKKRWAKSRIQPEAGFAIFTGRAAGLESHDVTITGSEMGTLAGYMLKVAALPMYRARFEVSYQAQSINYDNPRTTQWQDSQASTSVNYYQSFDDCSRIHGRLTTGPGLSETDLRYENGTFSVGFLQTRSDDSHDASIQFGYSLSLDSGRDPSPKCESNTAALTPFRTIVDAAIARSPYLPGVPLARPVAESDAPG